MKSNQRKLNLLLITLMMVMLSLILTSCNIGPTTRDKDIKLIIPSDFKTEYLENENIDFSRLSVLVDGALTTAYSFEIQNEVTYDENERYTEYTYAVKYGDVTCKETLTIKVYNAFDRIELYADETVKTVYFVDDKFDFTGWYLKLSYSDDFAIIPLTESMLSSEVVLSEAGSVPIKISYHGKENSSAANIVVKKKEANLPIIAIKEVTQSSVEIEKVSNALYSLDGINYKETNVFDNLSSGTQYTAYLYVEENRVYNKSAVVSTTFTTNKSLVDAPTFEAYDITSDSFKVLKEEGVNIWCDSGMRTDMDEYWLFYGLQANTGYDVYGKYIASQTTYESDTTTIKVYTTAIQDEIIINDNQSFEYNGSNKVPTFSLLSGEIVNLTRFNISYTQNGNAVNSVVNCGEYKATITNIDPKYSIKSKTITLIINKRDIEVTADNIKKVYGDDDALLTYKVTSNNLVYGDKLIGSLVREEGEDVGEYQINVGTLNNSNYNITFVSNIFEIERREIEITIENKEKEYSSKDPSYTFVVEEGSLVASSPLNPIYIREEGEDVGEYEISIESYNENYDLTYTTGKLTIVPSTSFVIPINNITETYNGQEHYASAQYVEGLTYSYTYNGSSSAPKNAGTYEVITTAVGSGNYSGQKSIKTTLKILKKEVSAQILDATKVYGSENPTFSYEIEDDTYSDVFTDAVYSTLATKDSKVGTYVINATGIQNTNYTVNILQGQLTITKKDVNVNALATSKEYGEIDPIIEYSQVGLINDDAFEGKLSRVAGEFVGNYDVLVGSLNNPNYNIIFTTNTFSIVERAITLKVNNASKIYGNVDPEFTYSIYEGVLLDGDTLDGTLNREEGEDVGTYTISGGISNANYNISYISGKLTINPSNKFTIKASSQEVEYDGQEHGIVAQPIDGITFTYKYNDKEEKPVNTGKYSVTITAQGSGNYTGFTIKNVTLTILKRDITITVDNKEKAYGDSNPEFSYQITGSIVEGDTLGTIIYSTVATTNSSVGEYDISASGFNNQNYNVEYVDGKLVINKKSLSVSANSNGKEYGDSDPKLSYVANGLISGDSLQGSLSRETGENVGDYDILIGTLNNSNYDITYTSNVFTITKAPLTITVDNKEKEKFAENPVFTSTIVGAKNSETIEVEYSCDADSNSPCGEYDIIGSYENLNYDITIVNGKLTINAATNFEIYADDLTVTYDGLEKEIVPTSNGDVIFDITYNSSSSKPVNAGVYSVTITATGTGDYEGVKVLNKTLTINKKAITITAEEKAKTYGNSDPVFTYNMEGIILGDSILGSLTREDGEDVGEYDILIGSLNNSNYDITYVKAVLTINKKAITVTAEGKTKTYGDSDPVFTYSVEGLISDDSLLGSLTREEGEDIGDYDILIGSLNNSNYDITYVKAVLTINKKALTITVDNKTKYYLDDVPELTYTVVGLANGDTESILNISISTTATKESAIGNYDITLTYSNNSNYDISLTNGILEVLAQANFVVNVSDLTVTYDGLSHGIVATSEDGVVFTYKYDGNSVEPINVGEYSVTITATGTNNYSGTKTEYATLTILPKSITITADSKTSVYGEELETLTYSYVDEIIAGNDFSGAISKANGINVGEYAISIGSLKLSNYTIDFVTSTYTITKRSIVAKVDDSVKTYGDDNPSFTYSITSGSVVNGDLLGSAQYSTSAVKYSQAGSYDVTMNNLYNVNYNISFEKGTLTINKKEITISANENVFTYNGYAHQISVTVNGLVNNDSVVVTYDQSVINAGSYTLTANVNSNNYELVGNKEVSATVNKATQELIIKSSEYDYDGNAHSVVAQLGFGDGTITYENNSQTNVGTYVVIVHVSETANCLQLDQNVNLIINKVNITGISAIVSDVTYGSSISTGVISGTASSKGKTILGTFTFVDGSEKYNVGTYSVDVLFTPSDSNYSQYQGKATVNVVRKNIQVYVDESGKGYGNSDPVLTYTLKGLEDGDTYAASVSRASGEAIGEYNYLISDNGTGNYKPILASTTKFYILDKLVEFTGYSDEFTYRVGTSGTYTLKLSYQTGYSISDLIVAFDTVVGTATGTFNGSTVQFSGSGKVKLSLKLQNKYNVVFDEKVFEVVEGAQNIYSFSIPSYQDSCLHCDIAGSGQFLIGAGYYFYGNGYTIDYTTFTIPKKYYCAGTVQGTMDNVKIIGQYASVGYDQDDGNYATTMHLIQLDNDGVVKNCHLEYGRYGVRVFATNDNALIENTTFTRSLYGIYIAPSGTGSKLTVRDCDFISDPVGDNLPTLGVYFDSYPCKTFTLRLEGEINFNCFVTKDFISQMPTTTQTIFNTLWNDSSSSNFKHTVNGTQYLDAAIAHLKGDDDDFILDVDSSCSFYGKYSKIQKSVTILTASYTGALYTYDNTKVTTSYIQSVMGKKDSKVNHKYSPLAVKPNANYKTTVSYTVEPGAYYTFDYSGHKFIKYGEQMEFVVDSITQISTSFGEYEQIELGAKFYLGQYKVRFKVYDRFDKNYQYFDTIVKVQDSSPAPTIVFTYSTGKGSGVSSDDPFLWQGEKTGTILDYDYNSNIDLFFGVTAFNYKGNIIPKENYTIVINGTTFSNTTEAVYSRTTNNEEKNVYYATYTVADEQGKTTTLTRYFKIDSCATSPDNGTAPSVTRSVDGYGAFTSKNIGEITMNSQGIMVVSTGNNTYYMTGTGKVEIKSKRVVTKNVTKDKTSFGVRSYAATIDITIYYKDCSSSTPDAELAYSTQVSFSQSFTLISGTDDDTVNAAVQESIDSKVSEFIDSNSQSTRKLKYDSSGNLYVA